MSAVITHEPAPAVVLSQGAGAVIRLVFLNSTIGVCGGSNDNNLREALALVCGFIVLSLSVFGPLCPGLLSDTI